MKLLLDEMISSAVAAQLRARGHDVVAVTERPELRAKDDDIILAVALAEDRAIITENIEDFRELTIAATRAGQPHAPLIFTRNRQPIGALVTALHTLLTNDAPPPPEHWLR